jgi:hypothetical protein
MWTKHLWMIGAVAFAFAVMASQTVSAQDQRAQRGAKAAADRESRQEAPPDDEFGRPGSREGREFGPPAGGRRALGPRGDDSMGPGMPDRRGPGKPQGPEGRADRPRWPHHGWELLEKNDPEMYKLVRQEMDLERQTRDLAHQHRQAASEKRGEIKKQLEKAVAEQFDVRQQRRQLELKRLEEELQRLRDAIERRDKVRPQLVEQRVGELLGQDGDVRF